MGSIPNPRRAPTFPLTCSAHLWASSFFWISFARFSACFTAALAAPKIPPHHPPPPEVCACGSGTVAFSASSPSFSVLGVKLLWKLRVLSPDFRGSAFSSLLRVASLEGGVAVLVRFGEERRAGLFEVDETLGVWGRDVGGLGRSGSPSSSKRSSGLVGGSALLGGGLEVEAGLEEGAVSESMPSNWAKSSSSVSFLDILKVCLLFLQGAIDVQEY